MTRMRSLLLILTLGGASGGCAVTTAGGDRLGVRSADFAAYVEEVFRRQNAVATELSLALDSESLDSALFEALDQAELALQAACRGLNVLAEQSRDGEPPGGLGALKRARQAPECERAADAGEQALGSE